MGLLRGSSKTKVEPEGGTTAPADTGSKRTIFGRKRNPVVPVDDENNPPVNVKPTKAELKALKIAAKEAKFAAKLAAKTAKAEAKAAAKLAKAERKSSKKLLKGGAAGSTANLKPMTVALLGCDNAGKTSLCAALTTEKIPAGGPKPTTGFNNKSGKRANAALTLYDLGGGPSIRGIWDAYYADVHAAIFVVDASAPERFNEAATLLKEAWGHKFLQGKPLLVLANKQDVPSACSGPELADALRVHELQLLTDPMAKGSATATINTGVQIGSGHLEDSMTGEGPNIATASDLDQSLKWLLEAVEHEYESLSSRVKREVKEKLDAENKKKEERKARLAAKRAAREKEEAEAAAALAAAQAEAPSGAGVDVGLPAAAPVAA